jgi:class 3 adenylate cyclase/streptogramin lyase
MGRRSRTRVLATVMFTDIVGSTVVAGELGDRTWRELLARHHRIVRREVKRFGGREIDTAGDGFFATFQDPGSGIRCAATISEEVRELGIEIRAGIHMGEVEVADGKLEGIAVHIGARIMALSGPGQVLVSSTARDVVSGSGLELESRGRHSLKGVADEWQVYELVAVDGERRPSPPDPEEAGRRRAAILPAPLLRRRPVVICLVGCVALAAGVGSVLFLSRDDALTAIGPGRVGRLDPVSGQITAAWNVGSDPTDVAVGFGGVFVADDEAGIVTKIDPETGDHLNSVSTGGGPGVVEVDESHVWVLNNFEATVVKFSPDLLEQDSVTLEAGSNDLAVGEGFVWVTNSTAETVTRLDPDTLGSEVINFDAGADPTGVATGGGYAWVSAGQSLFRLTPDGDMDEATLRAPVGEVAYGAGGVWVVHPRDDGVSWVNPETLGLRRTIPVGNQPVDVVAGSGAAWVSNSLDGTVTRIEDGRASEIDIGAVAGGLAVGADGVWVAAGSEG